MSCGIAGWLALPGCGLVSGLDKLHTDDDAAAGGDATTSDASDDGAVDAATAIDVVTDGAGIQCGPTLTCASGTVCCITPSAAIAYSCPKDGCSTGTGITLRCDDKSDCTNNQNCCFSSISGSQCGLSGSNQCTALCNSTSQCTGGSACVPFDAGYGLSLMRCQ